MSNNIVSSRESVEQDIHWTADSTQYLFYVDGFTDTMRDVNMLQSSRENPAYRRQVQFIEGQQETPTQKFSVSIN